MFISNPELWYLDPIIFASLFLLGIIAFGGITMAIIDLVFIIIDKVKNRCNKDK